MKINKHIVFGALFAGLVSFAQGQTVINITGATAFRDAAHNVIVALMQENSGTCLRERADITLPGGSSASNLRLYKGNINGVPYIIRCTFSGSTQGILDLADQNAIHFLKTSTPTAADNNTDATLVLNTNTEQVAPDMAFSDVDKLLSARPNATLGGGPVGVIPFMFVAGRSMPAGVTNMTDQIHNILWNLGSVKASVFTGNPLDTKLLYATGRSNASGTRALVLSETRYGSFNTVTQYNGAITGTDASGTVGAPTLFAGNDPNNGHTSNSGVKSMLTRVPTANTFGYVSYLTISDALTATGYVVANGTISGGQGAIPLTYNGVRYSPDNVSTGAYTLWGFQQLYIKDGASEGVTDFFTAINTGLQIQSNLGTAGLTMDSLAVTRPSGDGGDVIPNE